MDLSAIIRRAIEIGERHGFITFDQINDLVPSSADPFEPEAVEEPAAEPDEVTDPKPIAAATESRGEGEGA